jgi:hypothetical protein
LAEKKVADFGTSNNITILAFTLLINRTKKFFMPYYNLCKIRRPFIFKWLLLSQERIKEGTFGVRAGTNFGHFFSAKNTSLISRVARMWREDKIKSPFSGRTGIPALSDSPASRFTPYGRVDAEETP